MKTAVIKLALIGAVLALSAGDSMANPRPRCGVGTAPPCDVPEPNTALLMLGAVGAAAALAKFRKK